MKKVEKLENYFNGTFFGETKNGVPNGYGKLITDNYSYEGEWENGQICGKGVMINNKGEKWEGLWEDNHIYKGKYTGIDGVTFEGSWAYKDGVCVKEGYGKFVIFSGEMFEGMFKNNKLNGKGAWKYLNNSYKGEFKDGEFNGKGVYIHCNGERIEGNFKDGVLNGYGKIFKNNGEYAEGEWENNCFMRGKEVSCSGATHEVNYQNRKLDGKMTVKLFGQFEDRNFKNGIETSCIIYDSFGDVVKQQFVNGKEISRELVKSNYFYFGKPFVNLNKCKELSYGDCYYQGEFKGEYRDGYGEYWKPDEFHFWGYWKHGKKNGPGYLKYSNGEWYDGNFKDDFKHGKGCLKDKNGNEFSGDFVNNKLTGMGRCDYACGNKYYGQVLNFKPEGLGEMSYYNKGEFIGYYYGNWTNGLKNGYGYYSENGYEYKGEWKNGVQDGKCQAYFKDGSFFDGIMKNGYMSSGKIYYTNNTSFEGEFDKGIRVKGKQIYANGDVYEGEFSRETFNGYGKLTTKEYVYEGQFSGGEFQGKGQIAYFDGRKPYKGEFIHGKRADEEAKKTYKFDEFDI